MLLDANQSLETIYQKYQNDSKAAEYNNEIGATSCTPFQAALETGALQLPA
jgi:hypothetical protein